MTIATTAKHLEFAASVDDEGSLCAEGRESLDPGDTWTAEHLVLAALCRCSLASLRFEARRAGVETHGRAEARGVVTKREEDGRYAFVEIDVDVDVDAPALMGDADAADLVARAEHGCFIGASLTARPRYAWRVNGVAVTPAPGAP
jgi:organic hydroperoxide reductase OsmC/OhrA